MFTHGAPAARDAGPNLLKISESALSQKVQRYCVPLPKSEPRKEAVICMGKKNAGANQAHKRCNCLDHRNVQSAPARTQRLPRCTVKRIPSENRKWDPTDDLAQQFISGEPRQANAQRMAGKGPSPAGGTNRRLANATIDSPFRCSPHFRRVRAAICSSLGAEMGCIGDVWPPGAVK
jgi:hypothetical protein